MEFAWNCEIGINPQRFHFDVFVLQILHPRRNGLKSVQQPNASTNLNPRMLPLRYR
jgi:hypothetical protein